LKVENEELRIKIHYLFHPGISNSPFGGGGISGILQELNRSKKLYKILDKFLFI